MMRLKDIIILLIFALGLLSSCSTKENANAARPVDLGLSVLWADHNLGAKDEKGAGVELCWNDSVKKKRNRNISSPWGKGWKTPSENELNELMDKCKWTWRSKSPKGYIVTGPNGNSIFLPFVELGYWSRDVSENHKPFASYMYFNSSYPALSYKEPEYNNYVRPVMKATKKNRKRCVANHVALEGIDNAEDNSKMEDELAVSGLSGNVLVVGQQSVWVSLQTDSLIMSPFVRYHSGEVNGGYPVLREANDYIKIQARGVAVFSFRVNNVTTENAVVIISYKSGDKQDEIEEAVKPGVYDIPAVVTNSKELTTIKLRTKSGSVIPTDLHILNSIRKVEMESHGYNTLKR